MATFRTGDRVRIVDAPSYPWLVGTCGVVVESEAYELHMTNRSWTVVADHDGKRYGARPGEIEPIQPERNQTIAWSECLWQPEEMREGVA